MTLCADCTGGAERCAIEGHLKTVEITTEAESAACMRSYLCGRCGEAQMYPAPPPTMPPLTCSSCQREVKMEIEDGTAAIREAMKLPLWCPEPDNPEAVPIPIRIDGVSIVKPEGAKYLVISGLRDGRLVFHWNVPEADGRYLADLLTKAYT